MMRYCLVSGLVFVSACTSAPNHLGNPLLLPIRGAAAAAQNANYNARRTEVQGFVAGYHPRLMKEITSRKTGPLLSEVYGLARVPASRQSALTLQLAKDRALYRSDQEALVVALMVHGE